MLFAFSVPMRMLFLSSGDGILILSESFSVLWLTLWLEVCSFVSVGATGVWPIWVPAMIGLLALGGAKSTAVCEIISSLLFIKTESSPIYLLPTKTEGHFLLNPVTNFQYTFYYQTSTYNIPLSP